MRPKILWIEDQADTDLPDLAGYVYASAKYDLKIAYNASEGLQYIMQEEFDAIIVDMRIPPGNDPVLIEFYKKRGNTIKAARLGFVILQYLLKPEESNLNFNEKKIPGWIELERFGVLTIEKHDEMGDEYKNLEIKVYKQKKAGLSENSLKEIIDEILKNRNIKV